MKEAELEKICNEFRNVAHAAGAVKDIASQVSSTGASEFQYILMPLTPPIQVMDELATQLKCPICSDLLRVPHR